MGGGLATDTNTKAESRRRRQIAQSAEMCPPRVKCERQQSVAVVALGAGGRLLRLKTNTGGGARGYLPTDRSFVMRLLRRPGPRAITDLI